ncbi:MAG: hypothetical protein V2A66_04905 [Pseudomonadota bacterium]
MPYARYILDDKRFLAKLRALGFKGVFDFAASKGIHRNTVSLYLKGACAFSSAFDRIARAVGADPLEIIHPAMEASAEIEDLDEIASVVSFLTRRDHKVACMLLGSRAMKKGRVHADWDIGITRGGKPIGGDEYLDLRVGVSDIAENLPHGVDLINLDAAPAWFLEGIKYDPIFLDGDRESFIHFQGVLNGIKKNIAA